MAAKNLANLSPRRTRLPAFHLLLAGLIACSLSLRADEPQAAANQDNPAPQTETAPSEVSMTLLPGRVWRVTAAPSQPAAGSIYVFLENGTLLETSCVESYRIATWTSDKRAPKVLHIFEDHRPAFTAIVKELTPSTMRLQQRFSRTHEQREITLTAVAGEFVCP